MKLQISFDIIDLNNAIEIATQVADYADIFALETVLIYTHGLKAVEKFKEAFPRKTILADSKIVDSGKDAATAFASAGADWITVTAGTNKQVIHAACTAASNANVKVMLDLLDASSLGQSAMEAKNLGAEALLFNHSYDESNSLLFLDKWEMIKGNSDLPVFISAKIKRDNVESIISIKPDGIVVGKAITGAKDPAQEAEFFATLCGKK